MEVTKTNRIFGLDFLRAIAISLVIFSHISLLAFPNSQNNIVLGIQVMGAIGVDLFFVLSGFLIGGIILKQLSQQKTTFKHLIVFWKRRWFRTLPNYYLILFLNIFIFILLGENLPKNSWLFVLFLQNFKNPHPNFFTEAWSLSIEEYAYLLLPFLMYLSFYVLKKINKEKIFFWLTVSLILIFLLFKVNYYFSELPTSYKDWSSSFRKVVIYRIDSIYVGFLLIYFHQKIPFFFKKYRLLLAGLALVIFIFLHGAVFAFKLLPQHNLAFYVFVYLQTVIVCLALLFPYFYYIGYRGFFFKPIQFISIHSYSIYLVNYSLILLTLANNFEIETMSILYKSGVVLLYLIITLFLSAIIYKYFEFPILKYRNKKY